MSGAPDMTANPSPAPGLRGMKFSRDWITRPVFGVALALLVIGAIYGGTPYLAIVAAATVFLAAREWHRVVGAGRGTPEFLFTTISVWAALATFVFWSHTYTPFIVLGGSTLVMLALATARGRNPLWQAGAILYLGIPALALMMLRSAENGAWLIVGLFVVVWATDTGALVVGNLVGGPRLAPHLSPNKTWSGTIGGMLAAAIAEAAFIALIGGHAVAAALFGVGLAAIAHLGDLFESWVKRHFHIKDSGSLIPGHGGVLDRIDSTLSAVVALAIVVFALHIDPLFGARP